MDEFMDHTDFVDEEEAKYVSVPIFIIKSLNSDDYMLLIERMRERTGRPLRVLWQELERRRKMYGFDRQYKDFRSFYESVRYYQATGRIKKKRRGKV